MAGNKAANITVFRKKWNINIGIIVFGVIFVYLVVTVLMYLTGRRISAYEVREGSILKDNAYTGFAVRQELIVNAESDGYVNYFASEGTKAGAKTKVYSVSPEKLEFKDAQTEESGELTAEEQNYLVMQTQDFSDNFSPERFGDVYVLKNAVHTALESRSSQSRQSQLDEMMAAGLPGLQVYNSATDGIVIYETDGYEGLTVDGVTEEMLSKDSYESGDFDNNMKIKAGDPVYKLITSDTWSLVIPLDEDTAEELKDTERINVQFSKDHETERAQFTEAVRGKTNVGILTFDSAMVRYAKDRYLDVELILQDESGLKIPKSSVVSKDFYTVPEDYLTQGGNSRETGVLVAGDGEDATFKKVDVYYRDNEAGLAYLDPNVFEAGAVLIKPDSEDTYRLEVTQSLKGVYNINKGYAVFKQIRILCESEEYYIVEAGNDYGLANYDHIALVGENVRENDVVF